MPKEGQYFYKPHGRSFRIHRYLKVAGPACEISPCLEEHRDREEARRRVYELNGWRYEPCKRN